MQGISIEYSINHEYSKHIHRTNYIYWILGGDYLRGIFNFTNTPSNNQNMASENIACEIKQPCAGNENKRNKEIK